MRISTVLLVSLALVGLTFPVFALGDSGGNTKPRSPDATSASDELFTEIPVVVAATLHSQSLEEAPASVSIISAGDIRKFGYRTLGEALSNVRGFYFTNDRMYDYAGVRGLSIPGDFNSRFLVMLNGHPLTENVYNSNNFFGQDFGLDMDLVERIEVIRGPSSALFGSNGMLATVNVITRAPVDNPLLRASVETGSFGEKKAVVSTFLDLGKGANLLLSTSVFNIGGRSLYYPEFDSAENNFGVAHNVDAQKGYHTFANLTWGRWSFTGYFNARDILVPAGGGGTIFDSQGQWVLDSRNFVGASYTRDIQGGAQIRWQLSYDQYRYGDRWDYPLETGEVLDNHTRNWGDWVNSQLTYSKPVKRLGTLTLGVQGNVELRNRQINWNGSSDETRLLDISARDRAVALFAQQEWALTRKLKLYAGLRFDRTKLYGGFVSPRLALVYQPSASTAYKLVYGRPFRNPSAFERFYDDGLSYIANPGLTRETAQAVEASVEKKLGTKLHAIVNAYHYRLDNVIQAAWVTEELIEYQNAGVRRSTGVEFELRGKPVRRIEAAGSFVVQKALNPSSDLRLPNSPARVGKARLAIPIVGEKVFLSGGIQYLSSRTTTSGARLRPAALADVTLSTRRLFRGYDLVGGVRNALHWQYDHPVDLSVERVRANGRTYFVKLIWQLGE